MALPVDPIYESAVAGAQNTRDTTLAGLGTQRTLGASQYGYTPTYDANGMVRALAVDPNSPYSRAALLKQSYDQNLARSKQSMASRGQLYAGAYGVAQSLEDQKFGAQSNNLQNAFINFIAANQGAINNTNTNYTNALGSAVGDRAARAAANDTGANAPAAGGANPGASVGVPYSTAPGGQTVQVYNGAKLTWDTRGFWAGPAKSGGTYHLYPQTVNGKPKVVVVK
jgi:hypothetical protein